MKLHDLFVFVTSLTKEEHEQDQVGKILPFVDQRFGENTPGYAFFHKLHQPLPVQAFSFQSPKEDIAIVKINGNSMYENAQENEETREFWKFLKTKDRSTTSTPTFLVEMLNALLVQFFREKVLASVPKKNEKGQERQPEQLEVRVHFYVHWATEYSIVVTQLKKMLPELTKGSAQDFPTLTGEGFLSGPLKMLSGIDDRFQGRLLIGSYSCHDQDRGKQRKPSPEEKGADCGKPRSDDPFFRNWERIMYSKSLECFTRLFFDQEEACDRFRAIEEEFLGKKLQDKKASDPDFRDQFDVELNDKWLELRDRYKSPIYPVPARYVNPEKYYLRKRFPKKREIKITRSAGKRPQSGGRLRIRFVRLFDPDRRDVLLPLNADDPEFRYLMNFIGQTFDDQVEVVSAPSSDGGREPDLLIALARMADFNDSRCYWQLAHRRSFLYPDKEAKPKKLWYDYYPIITVGLMNIMTYYYDQSTTDVDAPQEFIKNAFDIYEKLQLDKRFRFFDSSIWFQYVGLTRNFERDMQFALQNVRLNLENEIYWTVEANEYLEFHLRLLANSFISNLNSSEYGPNVTPFVFHSESRMRRLAEKERATLSKLDWRLLLVDDYADEHFNDVLGGKTRMSKLDLIKAGIQGEHFPREYRFDPFQVNEAGRGEPGKRSRGELQIDFLSTLAEAFTCLTGDPPPSNSRHREPLTPENEKSNTDLPNRHYDIILLNYLFDGDDRTFQYATYGFDLIRDLNAWILDNEEEEKAKEFQSRLGPLRKFYFLPISTYADAMKGKLQDLGLPNASMYWEIGPGVDPINTPQLFRYRLFYLMKRQLFRVAYLEREQKVTNRMERRFPVKEGRKPISNSSHELLGVYDKQYWKRYRKRKAPKSRVLNLLGKIVNPYKKKISDMQYPALVEFPNFVELGVYFKLLDENRNKSLFARRIIDRYFFGFDKFAWDHLQQLIYLLTYGTFQQKQEMWEEYVYLKQIVAKKRELFEDKELMRDFDKLEKYLTTMADYVTSLGNYNK